VIFTARQGDLKLIDTFLVNDPSGGVNALFGVTTPWDFTLTAGNDVVLQNTILGTGYGGNMTVTAGRDVMSPSVFDQPHQLYSGLRLDSVFPGKLTIGAGRDFVGGFVLSSGEAQVTVGRNFGRSADLQTGTLESSVDLTLGSGQISVNAVGDIHLGLVQDKVLAEGRGNFDGVYLPLQELADPGNLVSLVSETGSIYLSPTLAVQTLDALEYYPASFFAQAPQGSIVIQKNLVFWPSLAGSLVFSARDRIEGLIVINVAPRLKLIATDPATLVDHYNTTGLISLSIPAG
jgi:hypothetical protein